MSKPGSEANAVRRFTFRPLSVLAGTPPVRPRKNSARTFWLKRNVCTKRLRASGNTSALASFLHRQRLESVAHALTLLDTARDDRRGNAVPCSAISLGGTNVSLTPSPWSFSLTAFFLLDRGTPSPKISPGLRGIGGAARRTAARDRHHNCDRDLSAATRPCRVRAARTGAEGQANRG